MSRTRTNLVRQNRFAILDTKSFGNKFKNFQFVKTGGWF